MIISIDEFLKLNLKDEVFIIKTDTVFGIGCLYNSEIGAKRIGDIKGRNKDKFYSLLVSNKEQVKELSTNSNDAIDLMDKYWPGALTLIFDKSDKVKDFVTHNDTVGLRMPNCIDTLKAIEKFGPMIMTSLNKSGEPAITKYNDALAYINDVDYIVSGTDVFGVPSTVYDVKNKKVLRMGDIKL